MLVTSWTNLWASIHSHWERGKQREVMTVEGSSCRWSVSHWSTRSNLPLAWRTELLCTS